MGRPAHGVRGIDLEPGDSVIGMQVVRDGATLLTVTQQGYGKRTEISEYKLQNRGGKGILNYNITAQIDGACWPASDGGRDRRPHAGEQTTAWSSASTWPKCRFTRASRRVCAS